MPRQTFYQIIYQKMIKSYIRLTPVSILENESQSRFTIDPAYIEYSSQDKFAHILATTINDGIAEARFILLSDIENRDEQN